MINSVNPSISGVDTTERASRLDELVRPAHTNREAQVNSAEFAAFLSSLMASLDREQVGAHRGDAPATGSMAASFADAGLAPGISAPAVPTPSQATALLRQAFGPFEKVR